MSLLPTIKLTNEYCKVLVDVERAGIAIDTEELERLYDEYTRRQSSLSLQINRLSERVWGSSTLNLNSPEHLSMLLYSRKINNKQDWKKVFNLGYEFRGATKKKKNVKIYSNTTFAKYVNLYTDIQYKENKKVAGFKITPTNRDVTTLGFKTDKDHLKKLAEKTTGDAKEFLEAVVEHNAITHYITNFIYGIRRNVGRDGILHSQFNQAVTTTGRLSSSRPNYQNQPRGGTFPIRRVVVSRWAGGKILKGDFSQLEFREAAELSQCAVAIKDIKDGLDVHTHTAKVLTDAGQRTNRQDAKPHTFKPLYGGTSGSNAERIYYKSFLDRYSRISKWHDDLLTEVLTRKTLVLPSGREYRFQGTRRLPSGYVTNSTQIKNYPVQGFATADIVPLAGIEVWNSLKGMKSRIILFVHDEIVIDCHPDEIKQCIIILNEGMASIPRLAKEWWNYELTVPLAHELSIGNNWLDMENV